MENQAQDPVKDEAPKKGKQLILSQLSRHRCSMSYLNNFVSSFPTTRIRPSTCTHARARAPTHPHTEISQKVSFTSQLYQSASPVSFFSQLYQSASPASFTSQLYQSAKRSSDLVTFAPLCSKLLLKKIILNFGRWPQ